MKEMSFLQSLSLVRRNFKPFSNIWDAERMYAHCESKRMINIESLKIELSNEH